MTQVQGWGGRGALGCALPTEGGAGLQGKQLMAQGRPAAPLPHSQRNSIFLKRI